jgi:hypothetical protein
MTCWKREEERMRRKVEKCEEEVARYAFVQKHESK